MTTSPTSPIKFGTSGWRGLIADDFTFANVRLAVTAIADHVNSKAKEPTILVGYDPRFYSEEFSQLAVDILNANGIRTLLCDTFTPTPAIAYEIMRRKLDGAINFTASHNPAHYHGLKFSSADAGPALPEVTKDIEARVTKMVEKDGTDPVRTAKPDGKRAANEMVNLRETYLARLEQLVRFDVLRQSKAQFVIDALHGCGAGYLDGVLARNGVAAQAMRLNRDVLFDGTGPDVSDENLAPLFVGAAKPYSGVAVRLPGGNPAMEFALRAQRGNHADDGRGRKNSWTENVPDAGGI
jgi:phosphoglucomutase